MQRFSFYGKRFIYLFHDSDSFGKNVKRECFGLLGVGYVAPYGVVYSVLQCRKVRYGCRGRFIRFYLVFDDDCFARLYIRKSKAR